MAEKSLEIDSTLVKYNNPFLVIKHLDKGGTSSTSKVNTNNKIWGKKIKFQISIDISK